MTFLKGFIVVLGVTVLAVVSAEENVQGFKACYIDPVNPIDCLELSARPHTYIQEGTLPKSFDWRFSHGQNLVTPVLNQHLPTYCGACWAFATLSALSDRVKIARNGTWPEVNLSPQVALNCMPDDGFLGSCHGGYPGEVYKYVHEKGITDTTCAPYEAKTNACEKRCKTCSHDMTCKNVDNPVVYSAKEYGTVAGVHQMMAEIYARGPIACSIAVPDTLWNYDVNSGIYNDKTGELHVRHVVSVVGWGETDGTPYWVVRNSWGTYWGQNGFAQVIRNVNNINIENDCYWAVPEWTAEMEHEMRAGVAPEVVPALNPKGVAAAQLLKLAKDKHAKKQNEETLLELLEEA